MYKQIYVASYSIHEVRWRWTRLLALLAHPSCASTRPSTTRNLLAAGLDCITLAYYPRKLQDPCSAAPLVAVALAVISIRQDCNKIRGRPSRNSAQAAQRQTLVERTHIPRGCAPTSTIRQFAANQSRLGRLEQAETSPQTLIAR
jgi:hypothetical protein